MNEAVFEQKARELTQLRAIGDPDAIHEALMTLCALFGEDVVEARLPEAMAEERLRAR